MLNTRTVCIDLWIAYQSALLTGPLSLLRIVAALLQFPSQLCTLLTLLLVISCLYMAYVMPHSHRVDYSLTMSITAGEHISMQQRMDSCASNSHGLGQWPTNG